MSEDEALARRLQEEEDAAAAAEQQNAPLLTTKNYPVATPGDPSPPAYPQADLSHAVYDVKPSYPPAPVPENNGRFGEVAEWHDIPYAIIFMIVFLAFLVVCIYFLSHGLHPENTSSGDIWIWIIVLSAAALLTAITAMGWLLLMRQCPKECIMASLVAQISFCGILMVICFVFNAPLMGVCFMLLTLILGLYFWSVQKCIPFAAAMLTVVGSIMKLYPQCYYLALVSLLLQFAIFFLFIATSLVLLCDVDHGDIGAQSGIKCAIFFFAFACFWASQVVRNIVHMSIGGVAATWYFLVTPDGAGPPKPLSRSLKRATSTSFGSICFGSLLVAFVQTMRFMVRSQDDGFCAICVDCLLSCIESMLAFMNKYAFTYIAIYGGNFCDGGQGAWNLLKERGFDLIINDDLTESVFFTASVFTALVIGIFVGILVWVFHIIHGIFLVLTAMVLSFLLCAMAMSAMDSGVATMFVCFAEDPGQLEASRPDLVAQLRSAWVVRYGVEDWDIRMGGARCA